MPAKVIVLEFNELVPHLLDKFIAAGRLPNFAKLRAEAVTAITDAEEQPPFLEPWIQWVTVHTGVPYSEHQCFNLNDGAKYKAPRVWDLAADAGKTVWVCGSMNAAAQSTDSSTYLLPDPWCEEVDAIPKAFFEPYAKLVRAYVQEHSSGKPQISPVDMLRFGAFMTANGISVKTASAIVAQLVGERRDNTKWRRATILDRLQWDLFRSIYKSRKPDFATFFLNSTAHFQHFHWREMEPELFTVKSSTELQRTFGEAIAFGYEQMDLLVGEALALADSDTSVVLCTALSQQPMLQYEDIGGRQIFRHFDHQPLLDWAGLTAPYKYAPIMSQQFNLTFDSDAEAAEGARKIATLKLASGGEQILMTNVFGNKIVTGCMIDSPPDGDALVIREGSNETRRFWDLFYPLDALRSGMHHPDGIFWARTPMRKHVALDRKLSLLELAPTLLALSGVAGNFGFRREAIREVVEQVSPELVPA